MTPANAIREAQVILGEFIDDPVSAPWLVAAPDGEICLSLACASDYYEAEQEAIESAIRALLARDTTARNKVRRALGLTTPPAPREIYERIAADLRRAYQGAPVVVQYVTKEPIELGLGLSVVCLLAREGVSLRLTHHDTTAIGEVVYLADLAPAFS